MSNNNPYANNFVSGGYFYNPILRDLIMVRGDTMSFGFQLQGLKGQTPESVTLTCKETPEAQVDLFVVSLEDTIVLREYDEDLDILTYSVRVPPYLTDNLALGRYYYALELEVNNDVFTLMKGRFTLDYDISYTDTPEPTYENGDGVKYPVVVQVGVIKLYTEEYISDIASEILSINGAVTKYTTQEMSGALSDIKTDIDNIVTTINTISGSSGSIPLADIDSAILALNGDNIYY